MNNKPVAWTNDRELTRENPTKLMFRDKGVAAPIPLYTHPVKELTDEEIRQCILEYFESSEYKQYPLPVVSVNFARAILRKAQEK